MGENNFEAPKPIQQDQQQQEAAERLRNDATAPGHDGGLKLVPPGVITEYAKAIAASIQKGDYESVKTQFQNDIASGDGLYPTGLITFVNRQLKEAKSTLRLTEMGSHDDRESNTRTIGISVNDTKNGSSKYKFEASFHPLHHL